MTRFYALQNCNDFSTARLNETRATIDVAGRVGLARDRFLQGTSHAKQGRVDLLGKDSDYDAGFNWQCENH